MTVMKERTLHDSQLWLYMDIMKQVRFIIIYHAHLGLQLDLQPLQCATDLRDL